jgi:hypothetical protein
MDALSNVAFTRVLNHNKSLPIEVDFYPFIFGRV